MISRNTLKKHASLVDRMATARGIDLQETALRGHLTPDDISDAVLSCTSCANPDQCETWLEHQNGDAPSYCRNVDFFKSLPGN